MHVRYGRQLFQQMGANKWGGILMGTNCVPLLVNLFLNFYENEFLDKLIEEGKRRLARKCNLSLH